MIGITSYGAYIPQLRLSRMSIAQSMGWFAPAIMMVAQGERSMCNLDEDSVTMAVASSRNCLLDMDKNQIDGLYLASTTLPFADRQNAGIVAAGLNLKSNIITSDFTASQKAGSAALIAAIESVKSGERKNVLVTATDKRETKSGYFYEMWFGDGAASLMIGDENVIAEFKGSYCLSCDFVDHYRGSFNKYDYVWEERWARDAGYGEIIPQAINGLMDKLGMTVEQVDKVVYPCIFKATHRSIAKTLKIAPEKVADNMHEICGETGTAHALMMLARALENAKPGERIVMAGFGQGCNALCFEVTEKILDLPPRKAVTACLEDGKKEENYLKWLRFRELIETEMGIRAEISTQTAMTTLWRKNKMILGLVGGICRECRTPQFPKTEICVKPDCGAMHSQDDYEFSNAPARMLSFTADMLSVSIEPPAIYGMVEFEDGGRLMADFTDCKMEDLKVDMPVSMVFRKKCVDKERGMVNYFWKAKPLAGREALAADQSFKDRVAVVTGAGGGLGKVYALELAKRGAKVVVNDFGGARDGSGDGQASPADEVVKEIQGMGGEAAANYDNVATVEGGENIIKTAVDNFGKVDILINNAGILRDKSFGKMEPANWNAVMDVHLNGGFNVTLPAMKIMKENGYGRIVMTSSGAGLYGNFGQTNYSSAKMGLVGLMNALKLEGRKYNILINTIAPIAASRLTEDVMPPDIFEKAKPEWIAPIVLRLVDERCEETGGIFNCGMGYYNRAAFVTGPGVQIGDSEDPPTVEDIAEQWDAINSLENARELEDANQAIFSFVAP